MKKWMVLAALALVVLATGLITNFSPPPPESSAPQVQGQQQETLASQAPQFVTVQAPAPTLESESQTKPAETWLNSLTKEELQSLITAAGQDAIKTAIRRVAPSVVRVELVANRRSPFPFEDFFNDPFFRDFFNIPPPQGNQRQSSMGSGFFIEYGGQKYVLTNQHVVEGAISIQVVPPDHGPMKAEIVGMDAQLDLAVLRVAGRGAEDIPVVELGDSDQVEVGDWVVAIGNPYGLGYTVTAGIISYLHRNIPRPDGQGAFRDMIQTDAAINPGNSGGPLVDAQGRVIGINTAIVANAVGLGFATPINSVKRVLAQLITQGSVKRAWLGIYIDDLTPEKAQYFGVAPFSGVLVTDIIAGGPSQGKLQLDDIILSVNGQAVSRVRELQDAIQYRAVGEVVRLEVLRAGEKILVEVQLGERPAEVASVQPEPAQAQAKAALGLTVRANSEELAKQLGLATSEGVIIAQVEPGSPAALASLQPGEVIIALNNKPIRTVQDWNEAVSQLKKGSLVALRVLSGNIRRLVILSNN